MEALTIIAGIASGIVASLVLGAFNSWLEKNRGRLKVKVGPVSVDLDLRDPENAARELAAHMGEPQVFISYSFRDGDFALRLARDLKERGVRVWFPGTEIKAGASLKGRILEGLQSSGYMLPVLSEHSISSPAVLYEIERAIEREKAGKWPKVIPIRIDQSEVPAMLQDKVWLDMSSNYEQSLSTLVTQVKGGQQWES